MKKELFVEIFGWVGIIFILLAYFLVSYELVSGTSLTYQVINFLGSCGIFYNACHKKSKPLIVLQLVWGIIALISIIKIYI